MPACRKPAAAVADDAPPASAALASPAAAPSAPPFFPLAELRRTFHTQLNADAEKPAPQPAPEPPPEIFEKVSYPAPLGKNVAYVSPVKAGTKRPAIVWIAGGFDFGIDDYAWKDAPRTNDQTARAYREAGIVLMLPSLRGANDNPGSREMFLGEVDDVLAAADFVAKRPDVDPARVYLGGHSTGGTMALLAVASTNRFRAAFAFGPVASVANYGTKNMPFDTTNRREILIRSPVAFIHTVVTPTFVIEGTDGNIGVFSPLRAAAKAAPVRFIPLFGVDHFTALATMNELVAKKILADTGPVTNVAFSDAEIDDVVMNLPRE